MEDRSVLGRLFAVYRRLQISKTCSDVPTFHLGETADLTLRKSQTSFDLHIFVARTKVAPLT